jgi:dihydrolipoamide dehydrogenase
MGEYDYDVVIIGSGPGGYVAAIRASQLGLKTALVEKEKTFGGTCLNVGCIPSKALLDSTELFATVKNRLSVHGIGIGEKQATVDLARMMSRKTGIVAKMTDGVKLLLANYKVKTIRGTGKLIGPHGVSVETADSGRVELSTANIILATGSEPMQLREMPFDHSDITDSTDALSFGEIPERLAVIGGGAIGLEIGCVWSRLGSKVTIVEMMDQILPQSDTGSASRLARILGDQGLDIRTSTRVTAFEKKKGGDIRLVLKAKDGSESELLATKVLVAAGRRPHTSGLGFSEVGVKIDEKSGKIETDKHMRTSVDSVFAIGDIVAGPMLAHKASEEGIAAAEFIAKGTGSVEYEAIPQVVYTSPEYASVGPAEAELAKKGVSFRSGVSLFRANGRALAEDSVDGYVRIYSDSGNGRLLGAQIIGPRASELIEEVVTVMGFRGSALDIALAIHPHPSLSEVVREAAMDADRWAIHSIPKLK